jgi:hypothetical protein
MGRGHQAALSQERRSTAPKERSPQVQRQERLRPRALDPGSSCMKVTDIVRADRPGSHHSRRPGGRRGGSVGGRCEERDCGAVSEGRQRFEGWCTARSGRSGSGVGGWDTTSRPRKSGGSTPPSRMQKKAPTSHQSEGEPCCCSVCASHPRSIRAWAA